MSEKLPIIYVEGSHQEIGRQIGESMRPQIQNGIENAKILIAKAFDQLQLTWDSAIIQAKKYMPFAEERYPQYVEEMVGTAEGADVSFDEISVVNALEAVTSDALHLTKCTSVSVNQQFTQDGSVLIAHNEDWIPEEEPNVYLVHAKPDDEPPFLAMSYGGLLPNIGFNAQGIAQCCDSVYPNDSRMGLPRVVYSRAVLAASTLADAIKRILVSQRAAGYNHLIVHNSGEMYNIEVSAKQFGMIYGEEGYLIHTNFYIDPTMKLLEDESDELISARVRYFRALRLIKHSEIHTVASLQTIQQDHINYPDSICNHGIDKNVLNSEKTIMSLVIDLTSMQLHAGWGSPCKSSLYTYQLDC